MIYTTILIFFISLLSTYWVKKTAIKRQLLDIPNHRSSHSVPIPRGGGLAIAIVWYVSLAIFFILGKIEARLFWALLTGMILSIVSFVDDLKSLSPKIRMGTQIITAILALLALGGSRIVDLGFVQLDNIYVFTLLSIPFIVWFINLFNFLDGIDGYLGMEGVFIFIALWFFTGNTVLLIFVAAILGFLILNWPMPQAKIFCGDVGSTLIGFNVAVFAIYLQSTSQLSIVIPLILSSLFWFDATLTLFRRWRNGEKLSEAHRKHAYQRIVQYGFSHRKTSYYALMINSIIFILAFIAASNIKYILLFLILDILMLWGIIKMIDRRKPFE
ncbi:glycosyltransferase family 4 protein [Saccharicrinis sp. FJH2]|uniref:MraY family glycosyltransferase n=1 Tax=Saccharicrinis sp. FJH65 TaxID=3344659 RepID=UPI0035F2D58E